MADDAVEWTVKFDKIVADRYLVAFGDMKLWVIMALPLPDFSDALQAVTYEYSAINAAGFSS